MRNSRVAQTAEFITKGQNRLECPTLLDLLCVNSNMKCLNIVQILIIEIQLQMERVVLFKKIAWKVKRRVFDLKGQVRLDVNGLSSHLFKCSLKQFARADE